MQRTKGYLQGATGVIKTLVSNLYFYQDKLGSTTHVANASGQLVESYKYDLYGTPSYFNSTSQSLNSSTYGVVDLYAGERWIPELGLYDLRNRFMSPELGRFLQPDPIGFKGDASNLYRYCGNDPIDKSDPMGLFDLWGHLKWFFSGSSLSFTDWEADRERKLQLEQTPFSGVVNESGLGGGNWKDANVGKHAVDDNQMPDNYVAGTTYDARAGAQIDGSLTVHSDLNWRVARSAQNKAVVTTEIDSHVRSYRKAETAPNGRIRVALDNFKKDGFHGSVAAAARDLNSRLDVARAAERKAQNDQFHGGARGMLGIGHNPHDMSKNQALSRPIAPQDVEGLINSLP